MSLGRLQEVGHLDALTSTIVRWCHCWKQFMKNSKLGKPFHISHSLLA